MKYSRDVLRGLSALALVVMGGTGCKSPGSRSSALKSPPEEAQGTSVDCSEVTSKLRGMYANDKLQITFLNENTALYLSLESPGNQGSMPLTTKYDVGLDGFRCTLLLTFVEVRRAEEEFFLDGDYGAIMNREETVRLAKLDEPMAAPIAAATPVSPQGTAVTCRNTASTLGTYGYGYGNDKLQILFLDSKNAVYHLLYSPGNQGTVPEIVPYQIGLDGYRCIVHIKDDELFLNNDYSAMMNREETFQLPLLEAQPTPMHTPGPSASGCEDIKLVLGNGGRSFGNRALEVTFLNETHAVYHALLSPGNQGTLPLVMKYKVTQDRSKCLVTMENHKFYVSRDINNLTSPDGRINLRNLTPPMRQ